MYFGFWKYCSQHLGWTGYIDTNNNIAFIRSTTYFSVYVVSLSGSPTPRLQPTSESWAVWNWATEVAGQRAHAHTNLHEQVSTCTRTQFLWAVGQLHACVLHFTCHSHKWSCMHVLAHHSCGTIPPLLPAHPQRRQLWLKTSFPDRINKCWILNLSLIKHNLILYRVSVHAHTQICLHPSSHLKSESTSTDFYFFYIFDFNNTSI